LTVFKSTSASRREAETKKGYHIMVQVKKRRDENNDVLDLLISFLANDMSSLNFQFHFQFS